MEFNASELLSEDIKNQIHPTCASIIHKIHPREYYRRFVHEYDCRPDERALASFRSVTISCGGISTANSSAYVKIGKTTVLCVIKAEVAAPTSEAPGNGYFVANVELPPLCSSRFKPGPPASLTQSISRIIANIHAKTPFIDQSDLCIAHGEAVWALYADIYCLSHDGSILDAALVSLAAALHKLKIPVAHYNPEEGSVRATCLKKGPFGKSPKILHIPLSVSFITFEGKIIADPTLEEEDLQSQRLFVIIDCLSSTSQILGIHKSGGEPIALHSFEECVRIAKSRVVEIVPLFSKEIE